MSHVLLEKFKKNKIVQLLVTIKNTFSLLGLVPTGARDYGIGSNFWNVIAY
jgi:hypothetical protein